VLKVAGELCKVDKLGRIVIPKKIRQMFNLTDGSCLELLVDDDKIVLQEYIPQCIFCGTTDNLTEYKEKCICKDCIDNLSI